MLTLLADAMFTATLARRGNKIPEHLKDHADRHIPQTERKRSDTRPFRHLW